MARSRGVAEQADFLDAAKPDKATCRARRSAAGHRLRMRKKLLNGGADTMLDHELIEMVLFLALPRRDTKPIAHDLVRRFGDFAGAIAAPVAELRGVDGLGESGTAALRLIGAGATLLGRQRIMGQPVLNNWDRLLEYLNTVLARERIEQFRVLFLDGKNRLIGDEAQTRGTVNHTPVYPREIASRALELKATALILVHNHPSGDPNPSPADMEMTNAIVAALQALSIVVHDHLIIGNGRHFSFRSEGLL